MKILTNLLVAVVAGNFAAGIIVQAGAHDHGSQTSTDPDWSELIASMEKIAHGHGSGSAIRQ